MNESNKNWVGVDVAKNHLDIYVSSENKHEQILNKPSEIKAFIRLLNKKKQTYSWICEASGGYENLCVELVQKAGFSFSIVNARRARDFAKAMGILAKTDKIDAKVLACYGEKLNPEPSVVKQEEAKEREALQSRRRQLVGLCTQEKNHLERAKGKIKKSIESVIKTLEKQIKEIEEALSESIEKDEELKEKSNILQSVKGIGKTVSTILISELPELGHLNRQQVSHLVGVAPLNKDSGQMKGKRQIWGGRKDVRNALYMSTLVAVQHNAKMKQYYEKLRATGKEKKVALIACLRKLLLILNQLIKTNTVWDDSKVCVAPI